MKYSKLLKQTGALAASLVMTATPCLAAVDSSAITPIPGPHGYFVDSYKTNSTENMSPESNAVIGVLSPFLSIWEPGNSWDNGKKLGDAGNLLLDQNIRTCIQMTNSRTKDQELAAYLTDRRSQNYTALDGLGSYETTFKQLANVGTSLPSEIPADARTKKYSDSGNENGVWADENSSVGSIVTLVNTVRGPHASGNPSKVYFQYTRPYRWSSDVKIAPSLIPCTATNPMTDGGFPSGHTNAGYLASLTLAYAVPEQYRECLANASEIGNYRVIAGMHSPMDVIGGRTMATALAAAALNDPANAELKAAARKQAEEYLLKNPAAAETTAYENAAHNKDIYAQRMTYNFSQTGAADKPMVVPKGAEVLLETRFPYLNATQRRWVLYSTGLPSGYAFLEDAEGWGRLNLYDAADGYGAFHKDVSVTMDAKKGGFNAYDDWRNNIFGEGSLCKNGTGTLVLSGNNSYTGGVHVYGGTFVAASAAAFGKSSVDNMAVISEAVAGSVEVKGDFIQTREGTLKLDINSADDCFKIGGAAKLNGAVTIDFTDFPNPEIGMEILMADQIQGQFTSVTVTGLDAGKTVTAAGNSYVVTAN